MSEPKLVSFTCLENSSNELITMHILEQVMEYCYLEQDERIRVAEWFHSKYSYTIKTASAEGE